MRTMLLVSALLLAYAGAGRAALGGLPTQFEGDAAAPVTHLTTSGSSYATRTTTLDSGTQVSEYVSDQGLVFAVAWNGPVLPDLKALLGKYFDTLVTEQWRTPRAGRPRIGVDLPEVVIHSGGHMRAFEGSAWIPAGFPAGFSTDDVR